MYVRVICVLSGGGKDMEEVNILEKNPNSLVVAQNFHFFFSISWNTDLCRNWETIVSTCAQIFSFAFGILTDH